MTINEKTMKSLKINEYHKKNHWTSIETDANQ